MKNSNWKLIAAAVFGAAAFSTQAHAGWYGGDCAYYYANGGTDVCVEYTDDASPTPGKWHIGTDNNVTTFKGPFDPNQIPTDGVYTHADMGNFEFVGTTDLACFNGSVTASCTLELDGKVSVNGSTVNIDINGGSVTGGGLCSGITVKDFSWYIASDSSHDASDFYPGGGIVVSSAPPLVGAVGSIGFTVKDPLFGITLVDITDSHIHGVTFDNDGSSASSFTFANDIYENGTESNTGCSINGALYVANVEDININHQ